MVALGSVLGTLKDAVDEVRADGLRVGVLGMTTFRPFPCQAIREALTAANRHVVVLERALAPGTGGIVDRRSCAPRCLAGCPGASRTVVAGLGGRAITSRSLRGMLAEAAAGRA